MWGEVVLIKTTIKIIAKILALIVICSFLLLVNKSNAANANQNNFSGKTFAVIGDSITSQDGKKYANSNVIAVGYQQILKDKLGFNSYINLGVSGAPVAENTKNGNGLYSITKDYNLNGINYIIIAAGTNDYRLDVPLGDKSQIISKYKDTNTFYGAYSKLVENIIKNNPDAKIQLWTPLVRKNNGYNSFNKNKNGHTLIDYVVAIRIIADYYNLPVCDMFKNSGITLENIDEYTYDGLHPNNKGYQLIGEAGVKCFYDFYEMFN